MRPGLLRCDLTSEAPGERVQFAFQGFAQPLIAGTANWASLGKLAQAEALELLQKFRPHDRDLEDAAPCSGGGFFVSFQVVSRVHASGW